VRKLGVISPSSFVEGFFQLADLVDYGFIRSLGSKGGFQPFPEPEEG